MTATFLLLPNCLIPSASLSKHSCWASVGPDFFYAFKQGVQVSVDTVVVSLVRRTSWASMAARSEQHLTRNAMVELAINYQFRQQYVASAKCDTYEQLEEPSNAEDIRGSESGTRSAASEVLATCSSSRMVALLVAAVITQVGRVVCMAVEGRNSAQPAVHPASRSKANRRVLVDAGGLLHSHLVSNRDTLRAPQWASPVFIQT